jgi:hypothetical protein
MKSIEFAACSLASISPRRSRIAALARMAHRRGGKRQPRPILEYRQSSPCGGDASEAAFTSGHWQGPCRHRARERCVHAPGSVWRVPRGGPIPRASLFGCRSMATRNASALARLRHRGKRLVIPPPGQPIDDLSACLIGQTTGIRSAGQGVGGFLSPGPIWAPTLFKYIEIIVYWPTAKMVSSNCRSSYFSASVFQVES